MLKKKSFLLVLILLVFSKELLFLNEELVLFFSFLFLVFVFLQGGVRLVGEYFDGEINAISVRFGDLLRRRLVVVNDLLAFRSSQIVAIDMLKQVFLLVLANLPDVAKFSYSIIYTFYNKLFSFFLALQLRTVNEVLLLSLSVVSAAFVPTRKNVLVRKKKLYTLRNFRFRHLVKKPVLAFWIKPVFRSFLLRFNARRKIQGKKVFKLRMFNRKFSNRVFLRWLLRKKPTFFSRIKIFFRSLVGRAFTGLEKKKEKKVSKGKRRKLSIKKLRKVFLLRRQKVRLKRQQRPQRKRRRSRKKSRRFFSFLILRRKKKKRMPRTKLEEFLQKVLRFQKKRKGSSN